MATCGACGCPRRRALGTQLLVDAIGEFLGPELVHRHIVLKPEEGRARARFFAAGAVLAEQALPGGDVDLEVSMPRQAFEDLCRTRGSGARRGAVCRESLCPPRAIPKIPRPRVAGVLT